jgi:hypothetical protein
MVSCCCCCVLYRWWLGRLGVPMSPGYGIYQTSTPSPYYTSINNNRSTGYYTTKAPEYYHTTCDALSYYTKTWSITLPRAASPKSRSTTPRFPSTTPLRHRNTSRLRMLPLPTTPRVLITTIPKYYTTTYTAPSYYTDVPKYYSALKESSKKKMSYKRRNKVGRNPSSEDTAITAAHYLSPTASSSYYQLAIMGKYSIFDIEFCINSTLFYLFISQFYIEY